MSARHTLQRRRRLKTMPGPESRVDYLVTLSGNFDARGLAGDVEAVLRYAPDRLVLRPEGFHDYLQVMGGHPWAGLEDLAVAMLADLNSELVPRWVRVSLASRPRGAGENQRVVIEDRQPEWDNPALTARLEPV